MRKMAAKARRRGLIAGGHGSHVGKRYSLLHRRGTEAQKGGYCADAFVAVLPDPCMH